MRPIALLPCLLLAAAPAPAQEACPVLSLGALVERVDALSQAQNDERLLAIRIEDIDASPNEPPYPEAIVLIEETLRGGSESMVRVEVHAGRAGGVCDAPATLELHMDQSAPYAIETFPTDRPGVPGLDIRYRFFQGNAFGTYATASTYVSDERRERYLPDGDRYVLSAQEIIECVICAPRRVAD